MRFELFCMRNFIRSFAARIAGSRTARPVPTISLIVCTRDRQGQLAQAIASLQTQSLAADRFDIVIVDNSHDQAGAHDNAERYARDGRIAYIVEPVERLSLARNIGAAASTRTCVAFMDDDARAEPDWAEALVHAFTRFGRRTACVGGPVRPIWGAPRPAWLHDELLGLLSVVEWPKGVRRRRRGEWFAGCNIAFNRTALVGAHGFPEALGRGADPRALLSNEEISLMRSLEADGRHSIYASNAVVHHHVPAERLTQSWLRRRAAWQVISDFILDPHETIERIRDLDPHRRSIGELRRGFELAASSSTIESALDFRTSLHRLMEDVTILLDSGIGARAASDLGFADADVLLGVDRP
jgi:glycosyltransferase involved in cell wall biosynthesis